MKSKIFIVIMSAIMRFIFSSLFLTCKWKITNLDYLNSLAKSGRPVLLCGWHSRLLFVAQFFKKNSFNVWGISSEHRDSEIMARILIGWRWKLIRGSSTRGWRNVIREMKKKLNDSTSIIAITNDGPRGPAKIAKRGSISLAIQHDAHIVSMSCSSSSFWELPSWAKTRIPKPFSTIYVSIDNALDYDKDDNEVEILNNYLNSNLDKLDRKIKDG